MFSSTDFNSAVPQFSHGSYASNPLSPMYIEEPSSDDYNNGVAPLQTLPAQWWNWLCNQFTSKLNKVNVYVKNIFDELTNLLSLVGVTPNASEGGVITSGQIKDAFETKYPNYISKFIHTLAELWTYTGTVIVGDVTTTQTSRLAIFEHVNTSDASTSPATETDEYKTKYIDKLPIALGGTGADNANTAMVNLVDPLTKIAQNTGLITDAVVFERDNGGVKSVQKMDLSEVGRIVSSTRVNVPIVSASSTTINSAVLANGDSIQVLFTADIGGSDTTTGLSLVYNGTTTPVKVAKDGSLVDFTAVETATNIFKYLQKYTTLELYFDGTNFVILGNPLVLSSADYEIYANGYNNLYEMQPLVTTENVPIQFTIPKDKREIILQHINKNNKKIYSELINDISSIVNSTVEGLIAYTSNTNYIQLLYTGLDNNGNYLFEMTVYSGIGRIGWK